MICGTELANEHLKAIESLQELMGSEILGEDIKTCECGDYEARYNFTDELGNNLNVCEKCLVENIKEAQREKIKYSVSLL